MGVASICDDEEAVRRRFVAAMRAVPFKQPMVPPLRRAVEAMDAGESCH